MQRKGVQSTALLCD